MQKQFGKIKEELQACFDQRDADMTRFDDIPISPTEYGNIKLQKTNSCTAVFDSQKAWLANAYPISEYYGKAEVAYDNSLNLCLMRIE